MADATLEKAQKTAANVFNSRTGKVTVDARAGRGALYAGSANLAVLQDVGEHLQGAREGNSTGRLGRCHGQHPASALNKLATIQDTRQSHLQATKVVVKNLGNSRFVAGFGSNGGEEFLSYMNISETLAGPGRPGLVWPGTRASRRPEPRPGQGRRLVGPALHHRPDVLHRVGLAGPDGRPCSRPGRGEGDKKEVKPARKRFPGV